VRIFNNANFAEIELADCTFLRISKKNWDECGGFQLIYAVHMLLAWGVVFGRRTDRVIFCIFSVFDGGWSVCVCVCVYTHTHQHTARGVQSWMTIKKRQH